MNSPTVNSLLDVLVVPNVCSRGSVVVRRRFLNIFAWKETPPKYAVIKLCCDLSFIPPKKANYINELHYILTLP